MKIEAVKTRLVHANEISLNDLLAESIKTLPEDSIVAISSKVAALCEGRVVKKSETDLSQLIEHEAELFLDPSFRPQAQGKYFTINGNTLVSKAGIDESNVGENYYVLWPQDLFATANNARKFLREKFGLRDIGVIIIDSVSSPMRRGTRGDMIAWSGFEAVNNYVGSPDLFGRDFRAEMSGIGTSLAVAANVVMGEGTEQAPLAIISDINFVKFVSRKPSRRDIELAFVRFDDDIFMPFLRMLPWQEGGNYDNRIVK